MESNNKPLYNIIRDYLKEKIEKREFLPEQQLPTEKELAEQFKVSRITTKRAYVELEREGIIYRIKGSGSYVSKEDAFTDMTKENNSPKMNVVALIMPFGGSLGRGMDLIHGLSEVLNKFSYFLTVHISNQNAEEERKIINNLVNSGVSGIVLYPVSNRGNIDLINRLLLNNYPIITIDQYFDAINVSSVLSDNYNGGYMATSHLIELGHTDIVYVTDVNIDSVTSARDRYFGFCKAIKDNGLELNDDNLIFFQHSKNDVIDSKNQNSFAANVLEPFKKVINTILSGKKKYTAIQTINDYIAIFLLKAANEMGVNVPNDLSIIGFDNIENCVFLEVPLTTIDQNFNKIGEAAGNLIYEKIKNPSYEYKHFVIPVEIIKRNSTTSLETIEDMEIG